MCSIDILHSALQVDASAMQLIGYLGPGGGLSTIGSLLALLAAVVVALFGFVWFPIKRVLRLRKRQTASPEQANPAASDSGSQP